MRRLGLAAILTASLLLPSFPAGAAIFNPHYVISDDEMRRADTMSYEDVRLFLAERGTLNQRTDIDAVDGKRKEAAGLIYDAAQRYRINPRYILALMEKESSVITMDNPGADRLNWATGYALCDGCSRRAARSLKYKGVDKQIDAGAGWMDWYLKNAASTKLRQPKQTYIIDQSRVTPQNLATAALYNYTPHLHGNRLLFSIWNRWFGDGAFGLDLPEGTLVRNEKNGAIAVIQGGKFRPIANRSVLASRFRNRDILDLNEYDFAMLEKSRGGRSVRLPDLSVVRAEDGATYLLIGDERRHIVSPQAFAAVGFNPEEVEEVTTADLADYRLGRNITEYDARPDRRVGRDRQDGSYWLLEAGVRHAIVHPSLLTLTLSGLPVQTLPHEEIAAAAD